MPGQTPKYALPYPTQGDPLYQGAAQMQALAVAIETTLSNMNVPPGAMNDPPSVSAIRTSGQSIPNLAITMVTFESAEWDTKPGGSSQYSTNGVTIRTAGIYRLHAVWPWADKNTGDRALYVYKNGTATANIIDAEADSAKGGDHVTRLNNELPFAAGDVIRIGVFQGSGAALLGGASMYGGLRGRLTLTYVRPTPA